MDVEMGSQFESLTAQARQQFPLSILIPPYIYVAFGNTSWVRVIKCFII